MSESQQLLMPILQFLHCETPDEWINEAKKAENLPLLLTDHMICELNFWMYRPFFP